MPISGALRVVPVGIGTAADAALNSYGTGNALVCAPEYHMPDRHPIPKEVSIMQHNILIADDELDIQMLLSLFFERQGYHIVRVRDGQEAINAALTFSPDLLLLDVQMPRKNGIEVVQELRANPRFADTPMIAITAYVRDYP